MLLTTVFIGLAQGQYNPAWGPSPCPNGQCVPKWAPTYNVSLFMYARACDGGGNSVRGYLNCSQSATPRWALCAQPAVLTRLLSPVLTDGSATLRHEQMSKSTIFMPCNYSGHYDPAVAAKFGIVDFVRCPCQYRYRR